MGKDQYNETNNLGCGLLIVLIALAYLIVKMADYYFP